MRKDLFGECRHWGQCVYNSRNCELVLQRDENETSGLSIGRIESV